LKFTDKDHKTGQSIDLINGQNWLVILQDTFKSTGGTLDRLVKKLDKNKAHMTALN